MANLAVLTALAGRGTIVFSDALNHASLVDGVRLSRAQTQIYQHADTEALDASRDNATTRLIVTDTVFSMDGDIAPFARLVELAEKYGAWLVVDDAHGFGVLGPQGRGALAQYALRSKHLVYVGTLGKVAGVSGAFVAAHATVVEWLIQRARPYIFTTAFAPAVAHAVSASVWIIASDEGDARRAHLTSLIDTTRAMLKRTRLLPVDSHTVMQPLVIGGNDETLAIAAALDRHGLWVPAIRPPTVPTGTSRLRVSLSAAHSEDDLARLEHAMTALSLFVAGTDTKIGKSLVSSGLLHGFVRAGLRAVAMKPIASGATERDGVLHNDAADQLDATANVALPNAIRTPFMMREPIAPHIAAAREGIALEIGRIVEAHRFALTQADIVVV